MNAFIQRRLLAQAMFAAVLGLAAQGAAAQQTIHLTIAASNGPTFLPVGLMKDYFELEVNRLLKEGGNKYQVAWKEAYGGTLYKFQDTMEAVRDGITDIGYVGAVWEADTMPLSNITYFTPFTTSNVVAQSRAYDKLMRSHPAMVKEWSDNNMLFVAPIVVETYDLWTTKPVASFADLKGRKINAPGTSARWLQGTGAIAVDGGLPTYYTNVQTGVTDGAVSIYTGILGIRLHEVAPFVTEVNIGAMIPGGVAVTKSRFEKLPREVQDAIMKAGAAYGEQLAKETLQKVTAARKAMIDKGAKVARLADSERQRWIAALPDIAGEWARTQEAKGIPARQVLKAYLEQIRMAGEKPERAWDH